MEVKELADVIAMTVGYGPHRDFCQLRDLILRTMVERCRVTGIVTAAEDSPDKGVDPREWQIYIERWKELAMNLTRHIDELLLDEPTALKTKGR